MPSRAELDLRAAAAGVNQANYPNDSKLEQAVIYAEKNATFTSGNAATGTLTSTGVAPTDGDTVTISGITYTFKTTLTGAANEVLIGGSAAVALDNILLAINAGAGAGTAYGTGTVAHPTVTATTNTNTTQVVQAKDVGTAGNAITTTKSAVTLSWGGATLAGGTASTGPRVSAVYQTSGGKNV